MECIYSKDCPFKSKSKNYQEMLLLLNLHILFAASWYTISSNTAVNVMISLALAQFVCFILQSFNISRQIWKSFAVNLLKMKVGGCFSTTQSQPINMQCDMEYLNRIPEVEYNFEEFQEPLIGQDI